MPKTPKTPKRLFFRNANEYSAALVFLGMSDDEKRQFVRHEGQFTSEHDVDNNLSIAVHEANLLKKQYS